MLVGSGNPEEGELRPQLIDRFGTAVEVETPRDLEQRIEVIRRRDEFERDPPAFVARWKRQDGKVRRRIGAAREALPSVAVSDFAIGQPSRVAVDLGWLGAVDALVSWFPDDARVDFGLSWSAEGREDVGLDGVLEYAPEGLFLPEVSARIEGQQIRGSACFLTLGAPVAALDLEAGTLDLAALEERAAQSPDKHRESAARSGSNQKLMPTQPVVGEIWVTRPPWSSTAAPSTSTCAMRVSAPT